MLPTSLQRYDNNYLNFDLVQKRETNWNFTGCQMPHFMIVLILYQFIKPFLDKKKKSLFLRNMKPLRRTNFYAGHSAVSGIALFLLY